MTKQASGKLESENKGREEGRLGRTDRETEAWGRAKAATKEAGSALAAGLRISCYMESWCRTSQHFQQKSVHVTFSPEVSEPFFPKLKSSQDVDPVVIHAPSPSGRGQSSGVPSVTFRNVLDPVSKSGVST